MPTRFLYIILSDMDTGLVLELGLGHGYREVRDLVDRTIPEANRSEVATFTADVWGPCIRGQARVAKRFQIDP